MFSQLARWLGLGGPPSGRRLREQARSGDPEARRAAAETLGSVNEPWACEELLVLLKDMMPDVRDAARLSLRMQGTAATGVLIRALEDADPKVAVPAAEVLGELKDLDAIRPLLLVMKFGSLEVRAAATRALVNYGRAAIPGLMLAIQDSDPWTRQSGEAILADIRAAETRLSEDASPSLPNTPSNTPPVHE
jgi:HEAT repeat protein